MLAFLRDLRLGLRTLRANPGFAAIAVLVLALGTSLNLAVFTLVNAILLRPMAGDNSLGEMVGLYRYDRIRRSYSHFSYPTFADIRQRNQVFSCLTAHALVRVGLGEGDLTRRVFAAVVPANYFPTFGVRLAAGRNFSSEEERPGSGTPVVIVGYRYWKRSGFDASLIGRSIAINARRFTIVGIAPRGFAGTTPLFAPEIWLPTGVYELVANDSLGPQPHAQLADRANQTLMLFGRLKSGITIHAAASSLRPLAVRMQEGHPGESAQHDLVVDRLSRTGISTNPQDEGDLATVFVLIGSMAAVVLAIACINLATMLLARAGGRRRDIAIRLALGARRYQVVRQLLAEGLVLSIVGTGAGLLLARWTVAAFVSSLASLVPFDPGDDLCFDVRVLAATLGVGILSTIGFGLAPACHLARTDIVGTMKPGERALPSGRLPGLHFRHVLGVIQIALSLALLTTAGLFARGALNVAKAEPGFSLDRSLVVSLDATLAGYDEVRGREIYTRILDRVRALPGVQAASLASVVPFGNLTEGRPVQRVGDRSSGSIGGGEASDPHRTGPGRTETLGDVVASYCVVGAYYFETLGIPLLRGRGVADGEEQGAAGAKVAVIDEPAARRLFGLQDPLGRHIYFPNRGAESEPLEIIGIARGTRHSLFDREYRPHVYVPFGQDYRGAMYLHVKAAGTGPWSQRSLLASIRRQIRSVDQRIPILWMGTMREHRDASMGAWMVRAGAALFGLLGSVAVLLAIVGVYGVRAYLISRRTHEIGVRMALGATRGAVLWLVVREGLLLVAAGLALGFPLAAGAGRLVASMLYNVGAFDPLVFLLAPLALAGSALLACYFPACRVLRIDPTLALRTE